MNDYVVDETGTRRCFWCGKDPLYISYHDTEWGKPALDDRSQFEFMVLESAQAGLSWITILRKREAYREAYAGFDPSVVAGWNGKDVDRLLQNPGIVRNRKKIEASIKNAALFLEISREYGSFADWLLTFYDGRSRINQWEKMEDVPVTTVEAETIAREMKKKGFGFFGPVITYSHLQATGIVDDHLGDCMARLLEN